MRVWLQPLRQPHGGRDVVVAVGVDQDLDRRADRLAHRGDDVDAQLLAGRRDLAGDVAGVIRPHLQERVGLERDVAGVDRPPGGGGVLLGRRAACREPAVGVERHDVAEPAAEQVVDWPAERLALDVPERDVDPADDRGRQAARPQIGGLAEELVPDAVDVGRVLADDELLEPPDGVADDQAAVAGVVGASPTPLTPSSVSICTKVQSSRQPSVRAASGRSPRRPRTRRRRRPSDP